MITIKYLEGLVKQEDTPWGWNPDDDRQEKWKQQREEYGFDERETWGLDFTFRLWFYQRLKMYDRVNCVNTSAHKFNFKNKKYTLQECIDYILEAFKFSFINDSWEHDKNEFEKVCDAYKLSGIIMPYLWW